MIEFNPNSPQHLSALLFGQTMEIEEQVPILNPNGSFYLYKSGEKKGQIKYQKVIKEVKFKGLGEKPLSKWETKKEGVYQTNEKVLLKLFESTSSEITKDIIRRYLENKKMSKQISTYFDNTLEKMNAQGFVYGNFNHAATGTGRTSCSDLNLQNQPTKKKGSKVTQHFVSRHENGKIVSADYSQIEPRTEAQLSGDPQYIEDIKNELDVHIKNLALKERIDYYEAAKNVEESEEWKDKRSNVKGFSFVQQYGGGADKTQDACGLSKEEIKDIKQQRHAEYARLYIWHDWCQQEVERTGEYSFFTGRVYKFKKYPCSHHWHKKQGITECYSYNQMMNYKCQGTATADIVLIMLGKFWREKALHNRDKYCIINTIHDSVMLDCRKEYIEQAKKDLKTLERVKLMCYNYFNYDWIVPIKIDISEAVTWYDL